MKKAPYLELWQLIPNQEIPKYDLAGGPQPLLNEPLRPVYRIFKNSGHHFLGFPFQIRIRHIFLPNPKCAKPVRRFLFLQHKGAWSVQTDSPLTKEVF